MSRPISDPVFDIGRDLQRAYDEGYKQGRYDEKVETETSLPSGEQTHALRTETHACDLIKRQDAIDGTVIITVDDYTKVNRIIVKDESHFGCVFEPVDYDEEVGGTMTREEAIEWLIQIQDKYIHDGDEQFDAKRKEALNMAIDALERTDTHECVDLTHACDLISRADAIDAIVNTVSDVGLHDNSETARYGATFRQQEIITILKSLPSADRPKGKWIPYLPEGLRYKCSECESKYDTPWHFCPNCGCYNGGRQSD